MPCRTPTLAPALAALLLLTALAEPLRAQQPTEARLRVTVLHDSLPVAAALVRAGATTARTRPDGVAELRLATGAYRIVVARLGFAAESLTVTLVADTSVSLSLRLATLESVVVAATRSGRRIEDEPLRVELLEREEIEEKMLMTPGDIAMMLNETSGLRVQTTSPSLGGANVRIQGLPGHYTQLLSDGLPLHGGQAGALGLLQIPPMDLQQVEVIKGTASALYGSQALGGVINLVSRRPGAEGEHEVLLNQTSRGGTDGVLWLSAPLAPTWGYTFLGGAHRQQRRDIDHDGWADLPGYERLVARPRLFWEDGTGRSLFVTVGTTIESRTGGTLPGRVAPDARPFIESLDTRRFDAGAVARLLVGGDKLLQFRASGTEQRHNHLFGTTPERDAHRTGFLEASLSAPTSLGTFIAGTVAQAERYRSEQVARFDFTHTTFSAFTQLESDPLDWLSLSASARLDAHSTYGTRVHPRLSMLLRASESGTLAGWTLRSSGATGASSPTPFTEETEVTGLSVLRPFTRLRPERARSASLDVEGPAFGLELHGTLFASVVNDPLEVDEPSIGGAPPPLRIANAAGPTRTQGAELFARWRRGDASVTGSYTFIRASRYTSIAREREKVTLLPRHAVGVVAMLEEEEESGRFGLELYYTGRQALRDNPYRAESPPYLIVGFLVERRVGPTRLFLNAENIGDVRQTRFDPLVMPSPGAGGRWTTDAWTELAGRTFNGGVRWAF